MSSNFKISFVINVRKLNVIVDLLKNEVTDLKIEQVEAGKLFNVPSPVHRHRQSKVGAGGIYGLSIEFCKEKGSGFEFKTNQSGALADFFEAKGVKRTNCTPAASQLARAHKIVRIGAGRAKVL